MIVWLNGTHGAGKTTTSTFVQQLIPGSRVFDAEKVGETLMDIKPGLPATDNFQHWPPWRPLVVETARRILDYTGGTLVMPMTVLVEDYWREISTGFVRHAIPVRHFVLHADQDTLRARIHGDTVLGPGPSPFRLQYLDSYAEAAQKWLHEEAEVIDTTNVTPAEAARRIADAVAREASTRGYMPMHGSAAVDAREAHLCAGHRSRANAYGGTGCLSTARAGGEVSRS